MVDQKKAPNPSIPVVDTKPLTTFVQVDTKTFREVVQRLTAGSSSSDPIPVAPSTQASPPSSAINNPKGTNIGVKKPAFKLHERRQYKGSKLEIIKPPPSSKQQYYRELMLSPPQSSPQQQRLIMSPNCSCTTSPLNTPTRCLANMSLLEKEITGGSKGGSTSLIGSTDLMINAEEEEKAIKERRFYLHPSPRTSSVKSSAGGSGQPELLNLFPVASPASKES